MRFAQLTAFAAGDPRVRVIKFSRNFGHQIAIGAGIDHARGDCVVVIDADLQDPPEVIARMVEQVARGVRRRLRRAPHAAGRGRAEAAHRVGVLPAARAASPASASRSTSATSV